jgi:hypothetical protein
LGSKTWSELSANQLTWDFANPSTWAQDAAGPTNIAYAIIYNNTDANKRAIAAIDLGGPISLVSGSLTISINVAGLFYFT